MMRRTDSVLRILGAAALVLAVGCGGDDPADPGPAADTTPPAAVVDLHIQSVAGRTVTVAWTAPGDDGDAGRADAYDLRWSFSPINSGNWDAATPVADMPAPVAAGEVQTIAFNVAGKAEIYVGLKTADEVPNWSGLSNVASEALDELFVVRQLTTQGDNKHPNVHDGVVVWVRDLGGGDGEEIFMFDLQDPTSIITRRTGDGGQKQHPRCLGRGYFVWSGRANVDADWQIHTCNSLDMCQLTQYTDDGWDHETPVPLAAQHFVWVRRNGFYAEIMQHRMGYADSPFSDICTPLYDYSNSDLDGDGDWIVWRAVDAAVSQHWTHLWNVNTMTHYDLTETIDADTAVDYSLDGGHLAFRGAVGAEMWVKYWDGSQVHEIAEGQSPSLSDGRIAYEVWTGDWDVHYWDGATIHEIAVAQTHDSQPSLDGDWLVWVGRPDGGDGQIFYTRVRD